MRKKFIVFTLILILLWVFASCTRPENQTEIYSFSGENENITINNGLIIVTDDLEKFIGGDLTFKGDEPLNVKNYVTKFFFYKEGVVTTVLSNSGSIEGTSKGIKISPDMGSSSSKDLFYGSDLEQIYRSLNFSVSGFFMNGEKFEYDIVLDVEKAY